MDASNQALVSVIITTYHNEFYLPRAIESVMNQSYPRIELIVVDDNPPESDARQAAEAVMQQYPGAVYLRHPENKNGAAARNTGIRAAKGEYIAFLDNDDFYFRDHIADCVQALEKRPECGCVLCGVLKIRRGRCWETISAPEGDLVKALLFSEQALGTGSNLFARARVVRELGGFDEQFLRHQDVEFALRMFSDYSGCSLDQVQIVKGMDGFSNAPDFSRFLTTKQQLWEKFQDLLATLTEQEQKRYFGGQYAALLYTACQGGDTAQITWTVGQLRQYRPLSGKERVLVGLCRLHLFSVYEGLKRIVKWLRAPGIYRSLARKLSADDLQRLRRALCETERGKE